MWVWINKGDRTCDQSYFTDGTRTRDGYYKIQKLPNEIYISLINYLVKIKT